MAPPAVSMPGSQNTTRRTRTCGLSGNGCGATDVLWRITPIKTASSGRLLQRRSGNSCGEKKPARISDEHSGSWGSNGLRPTVRRPKDGSSHCSETLQDRLVKEMRLAGIDSLAAANHFLQMRFLPAWEERFTVAPRKPRNVGSSFATNLVRGLLAPFEGTLIRDPKGNFLT